MLTWDLVRGIRVDGKWVEEPNGSLWLRVIVDPPGHVYRVLIPDTKTDMIETLDQMKLLPLCEDIPVDDILAALDLPTLQ